MSSFETLRDLAAKADPAFEAEVARYANDHLQKCNKEATRQVHQAIQRAVHHRRRAEAVPAILMELARLAVESGKPGVAICAYRRLLDEFMDQALKEEGRSQK